jgi:hypothetical protein
VVAAALLEVGDDPSWVDQAVQEQMGQMVRWVEQKPVVVRYQEEAGYGRGGDGTGHRYGKRRG